MVEPMSDVVLCECFARDGLQHEAAVVPTAEKLRLLEAFARLGFRRIEATSYANPAVIPQFADAARVLAGVPRPAGVTWIAICPNVRAVERARTDRAAGAGADELSLLVSATESHSERNLRRSREAQWDNIAAMVRTAGDGVALSGVISVAFGCPFEGPVDPGVVRRDIERFAGLGVTRITLADTVGLATPPTVRALFSRVIRDYPSLTFVAHGHDTRGTGLLNYVAALESGVRHFDSSFGGAGGHPATIPYGGGYTGNVCTEDLVDLFETMGVDTGIRIEDLLAVAEQCERVLGRQLYGRVTRSGLNPLKPARGG
jgi:hydroxymethylglutaryl-CoA lyase